MEIDPRLRDTAQASTAYSHAPSQHPSTQTHQRPTSSSYREASDGRLAPPLQYHQSHDGGRQSSYPPPHSPQSGGHGSASNTGAAGNGTPDGGVDAGHEIGPDGQKRPRACEACRGLKVRCELDPNNPEGACKRCAKANRNCVVTVPSRKRQKKTDSRVAELEKKIDALTATLQATKSGALPAPETERDDTVIAAAPVVSGPPHPYQQVTNGGYASSVEPRAPQMRMGSGDWSTSYPKPAAVEPKKVPLPPMVIAGQKRKYQDSKASPTSSNNTPSSVGKSIGTTGGAYHSDPHRTPAPRPNLNQEYTDVIDRGIISTDMATHMFKRYITKMTPLMPAVVFPPETPMAQVRKTKPVLFLAIIGAASGTDHPDLQRTLTKEVMQIYATRVICNGEKTLELIQALLISTLWYWPPEHFEELKFYQLIHLAAIMAIDINISKKNKSSSKMRSSAGLWRDHQWRRTPFPDPESLDARRAWLACYFLCCNTNMGLRRANLIRWSSYLDECIQVLETSPDAVETDLILTQWVRSQHIAEEVGEQFSLDDPFANVSISDYRVQHALKGFERDLRLWSDQVPKSVQSPLMKMTEHVLDLYMHEIAMHVEAPEHDSKSSSADNSPGKKVVSKSTTAPLGSAQIGALSKCLTAIDGIFTNFLALDVELCRTLPVLHFVRVAYAVVVLIKMYFAAATPNSELGKVINKEHMKVEQYLDGLLDHFRATVADDKSRPATKFLMVLIMLKTWFHRQKSAKRMSARLESANDTSSGMESVARTAEAMRHNMLQPPQSQRQHHTQNYSPANTPLQLLSEVATGSNSAQHSQSSSSQHHYSSPQTAWKQDAPAQPVPQQHQSYDSLDPMATGFNPFEGMPNMDPNVGMLPVLDYDINIGDGFEQAMGMTLGDGEFGKYFTDDAFFGSLMDANGQSGNPFEGL